MKRVKFDDLQSLEPRLLMASGPVFSAALNLDTPALGTLSVIDTFANKNETDTFSFTSQAAGVVTIDILAGGYKSNASITAYTSSGQTISTITNGTMQLLVDRNVKYYIAASSAANYTGQYTMTLTSTPSDDCGNSFAAAADISLPVSHTVTRLTNIQYSADVDMFAFTAAQTGEIIVDMRAAGLSPAVDGELSAYDAAGNLLAQNDSFSGKDPRVTFSVVQGQKYYFAGASHDGSIGGASLTITSSGDVAAAADSATLAPGGSVMATMTQAAGGLQLLVLGTNLNDTITLSQTATGISMTAGAGAAQIYTGTFSSIVICGFGGNDVIRVTSSVTAATTVYGGEGDDTIYDAGTGSDLMLGENGDDQLVSIGGGSDTIYAGDGLDSVWADAIDTLVDSSAAELASMTIHQVGAFYGGVSSEVSGQNLVDPNSGGYAYRSFASSYLFNDGPEYSDIHQGAVGDCYFLAALSSLADQNPTAIRQMITPLGDGTFAVRFFRNSQAVYVRIDADLPTYSNGSLVYAGLSADNEMWAALAEKAYAFFRTGQNSYASLNSGNMGTVYYEVTSKGATAMGTSGTTATIATALTAALSAGKAISVGSYSGISGPIVGGHAYVVKSVSTTGAGTFVTLYNPWGVDGRSYDSNSGDGLLVLSIADFKKYFLFICISAPRA